MSPVTRGFHGKRREPASQVSRVPPGQYLTEGFPVLAAGPTPHTKEQDWTFTIRRGGADLKSWTWAELQELPAEHITVDLHCVTRWSKLDTSWQAVSIDTLLSQVQHDASYVLAFCDGGYTTDLPVADVTNGRAWLAFGYEDQALAPEHGGPARLLVPHLYLWKSAKWVRGLDLLDHDQPGFWETYGYHRYGDPWKEQRYAGD
jgi:DMSO/TMAO reductase YedYZ molybdopterin-dependent catalytic subunit